MAKQFVTAKTSPEFNAEQLHARRVSEMRALIESGDLNPNQWYDDFKASQNRDTTLNDDELVDCIADEDDNADDTDTAEGRVRLMLEAEAKQDAGEETEEETDDVVIDETTNPATVAKVDVSVSGQKIEGQKVRPKDIEDRMAKIAAILNADNDEAKALREAQALALDAPVTQKMGPVRILTFFRALFGKSNDMALARWPLPYSVEKTDNKNPIKCETIDGKPNPDIYKAWRKNDKGKSVSKQQSAYGTLVDDTEEGIAIKAKRAAIAKAKEGKTDKSLWAAMYVGWGQHALDAEDSSLNSRRTRLITMYRQAVLMERQFLAFKDHLPKVEATFVTVSGATKSERVIVAVMKPIAIVDKQDTTSFHTMSVTSFLSIDVLKAETDGGTYEDVKTNTGNQDPEGEPEGTKWDFETFDSTIPDVLDYMEKHQAEIRKKLSTKKIEESAETLLTIWNLALECANICKQFGLEGVDDLKVKDGSRIDRANQMQVGKSEENAA